MKKSIRIILYIYMYIFAIVFLWFSSIKSYAEEPFTGKWIIGITSKSDEVSDY